MVLAASVQAQSQYETVPRTSLVIQMASVADSFEPWGRNLTVRDRQLREFWPTEPTLASALYSVIIQRSSYSWTLEGPPNTVELYQEMFHNADLGSGWLPFLVKLATDLYTQDNGAFMEIIRTGDSETSPVIGIAHLDSARCIRTGVPEWPVVYFDRMGGRHKMAPWQVITWEEFPSPIETMNGAQLCALSRVLRAAQLLRDIGIYIREKAAGSSLTAIHLVSGIKATEIDDAIEQHMVRQKQKGLTNFMLPAVLATLDPTATISHEQIDLASLPDNFDLDVTMRWYINQLALGLGADYQDFAPLPGRALGSGAQSLVLHDKSRGKGPATFIKSLEHKLNFAGVLPRNVTFRFDEQDMAQELEYADIAKIRAETLTMYVTSGTLTQEAARQIMLDKGDISQELFDVLQEATDVTPNVTAPDDDQVNANTAGAEVQPSEEKAKAQTWEQERKKLDPEVQSAIERALTESFTDLEERILESGKGRGLLRTKASPYDVLDDVNFWDTFRANMIGVFSPIARAVMRRAAERTMDLGFNINMELVNDQILDFTKTYINSWWSGLEDTTRSGLRKALTTWQETGLGTRGLPDLVDSLQPLFGESRAQMIATTEVTRLFTEGNTIANRDAGIPKEKYVTVLDSLVDEECAQYDGDIYDVGQGPMPPLHVNCRCSRIPWVGGL